MEKVIAIDEIDETVTVVES